VNQSLLQKAFGVSGHYRCARVDYPSGSVEFHLELKDEALVCPRCGSAEAVIRKGRRWRVLQTVPIGLKPVYLVTEVARGQCRPCGVIFEIAPPLPGRKCITRASSKSLSRAGAG
jgi:transposase